LSGLNILSARFGIITDGAKYFLFDRRFSDSGFEEVSLSKIISNFKNSNKIGFDEEKREKLVQVFKDSANQHLPDNNGLNRFLSNNNIERYIKFDSNKSVFYLEDRSSSRNSIENKLFECVLGDFDESKVCRYTTLDTLFSMLNNLTFRMFGLVGMNDKSEVNYVDEYLNDVDRPLDKMHHHTISALNRRYITSCSDIDKKDDLTLWRLYGENGAGVCLIFDVIHNNTNFKTILKKVKYANEDGNHPELEFIKKIIHDVSDITNFKFDFRKLNTWKHFFKPCDYSIEEEVRLLIIQNSEITPKSQNWIKTYSHLIINPCVDYHLNNNKFPLKLKKIILGPNFPEKQANLVQLQEMIRRKKKPQDCEVISDLDSLKIEQSNIKNYR